MKKITSQSIEERTIFFVLSQKTHKKGFKTDKYCYIGYMCVMVDQIRCRFVN